MTSCRDHIRSAMLEIRALASGEQPTSDELSDGLICLQGIVDGLFGNGAGTALTDLEVTSDQTLIADTRVLVIAPSSITLTFPEAPESGQRVQIIDMNGSFASRPVTLNGNNRSIPSTLLNSAGANNDYLYDATLASWMLISPLSADSETPFSDDEFFRLELGNRLAPAFGASLTAESAASLQKAWVRVKARMRSRAVTPCDNAVQFLSRQSYCTGYIGPGGL